MPACRRQLDVHPSQGRGLVARSDSDATARFLDRFRLAARQAGRLAVHLQREVSNIGKPGRSREAEALTAADLAAQEVILLLMHDAFPGVAVDAEEETAMVSRFPAEQEALPVIALDPIDGTYNYARGSQEYAVMGGWLEAGRFLAAVVHFPAWERTCWASRQGGCWLEQGWSSPEPARPQGASDVVLVPPHVPDRWRRRLQEEGFHLQTSRCSAVDATAPVTGRGAASVSVGPTSRRRPTGLFVSLMAGCTVLGGDRAWQGEDPPAFFRPEEPVVLAADGDLAQRIRSALG
jgi:fructose-1,6-bisphosphatase/inositol monophosphatase family enzyme